MLKWIQNNSHYIISILIFFLFFLLLTPLGVFSNWINPSDHTGYYSITRIDPGDDTRIHAYLRSMVIDGDIDFFNEIGLWNRFGLTPTGYSSDFMYAIGSCILWLPFFLVGHVIAYIYFWLGYAVTTDGYSFPYLVMTGIGSATYLFLGVILCYDLLKNFFSKQVALITANTVWLGTFLPFYAFIRSRMAHANEFFMVSLLLYAWLHIRKKPDVPIYLFLFGIVSGLLVIVRLNDLPILSFFAADFIVIFYKKYKNSEVTAVKNMIKGAVAFTLIFSIVLSIPFICAHIIWGDYSAIAGIRQSAQAGSQDVITPFRKIELLLKKFKNENLWNFFFSKDKGVFLSSPFWLLALTGMFHFWKKKRYWGTIMLIGLSFPLIFNVILTSTGLEYGIRRTTPALPFLAFGFAAFFDYTRINKNKWKSALIFFTGFLLILWQYLQLIQHKVLMEYNHPTFTTTAFENIPKILSNAPELLLRSSSWMKLIILKDIQLQNFNDIFYLIGLPALQLIAVVLTLILFNKIKISLKSYNKPVHPLIKATSIAGGLFFIFLPVFLLVGNPNKTAAEIVERRNFIAEINKFELNKDHDMIFLNDDQIYQGIAASYANSYQMEKAMKYANKSLAMNPNNFKTKFLRATIYHRTNRVSEAIKDYEEVLKIDPEHAFASKNLGVIYLNEIKDNDKALINFQKSIASAPQQEGAANILAVIKQLSEKTKNKSK